jgi:glycine oxidase
MPTSRDSANAKSYDVVVVGAGAIGLAVGWRAAQRGLHTLVLERERPGLGATWAAAGMLAPVNEATFGEQSILALNLESARRYPAFVAELEETAGISTGYRPCGTLAVALDRDQVEALERLHAFQLSIGLEAEWLRGRECRRLEPGLAPGVLAGIRSTIDHQIDPRALSAALEAALSRAGGELRPASPAARVSLTGDQVTGVVLESGEEIAAEWVVVAAGWRSGRLGGLPDEAKVPVRPVKGQILRLRGDPRAPVAQRVVGTPEVYVVPRSDGEVVVGATVEERGADTTVTAGGVFELLRAAYEVLPGIAELELSEMTAGLRPASPDNAPIVGRGAVGGLIWATAHWRNGILLTPMTADGVAGLLTGEGIDGSLEAFGADRFGRRGAPGGRTVSQGAAR